MVDWAYTHWILYSTEKTNRTFTSLKPFRAQTLSGCPNTGSAYCTAHPRQVPQKLWLKWQHCCIVAPFSIQELSEWVYESTLTQHKCFAPRRIQRWESKWWADFSPSWHIKTVEAGFGYKRHFNGQYKVGVVCPVQAKRTCQDRYLHWTTTV